MKKLLFVLMAALLPALAQSNQSFQQKTYYASDYGTWQFKGQSANNYQFSPAAVCNVSPPNTSESFMPFNTNAPVFILDALSSNSEVVTPTSIVSNASYCGMIAQPIHAHYSFSLMSATGGLQEVLNQISSSIIYPTEVILDRNWYTAVNSVPGVTASAVIGAAKGSTAAYLVDKTQAPNVYYSWNGTHYVAVAGGGSANFPSTPGVVYNTSPTASENASSPQVATVLNTSPSTLLVPGVLPLATSDAAGIVKPDNTTLTVGAGGVLSASPPATTPCVSVVNGIQYNNAGSFGCNAALTFTPGTNALTLGPIGTTAGSNSGPFNMQAVYNNGSGLALDTFNQYIQIGSGVNPFAQMVFDNPSGSPGGGIYYFVPPVKFSNQVTAQSTFQLTALTPSSSVCTDAFSNLATSGCPGGGGGGGGGSAVTPQTFGGFGDAATISNGCTTNGTTTIVCPVGPFTSTANDGGKQLCVQGAGAAGIGFCSVISTVVSSTTAVVVAAPSTNLTQAPAVVGHDDVVAIQACFNYSGAHNVQCQLNPIGVFVNTSVGYLVYSAGLTIPTHSNIMGSATYGGTTIFSEFNGDIMSLPTSTASLAAGQPVSGVTMSNIDIIHDPTWPAGRGIHLNALPGIFGFGGMYYSTFNSVADEGAALEALWMDGHTNAFGDDNPNQYVTFNNCIFNGPDQPHPTAEIRITGIQAQILFSNGAINGTTFAHYPNPLIYVGEKNPGGGESPGSVTFFDFTYEVGTQGLYVGNGSTDIHYDNSYVEDIGTPLIVEGDVDGLTYRGNLVANSGTITAVAEFIGSAGKSQSATLQDNRVFGGFAPAAFAVCTGGFNDTNVDFLNNISTVNTTSNCATTHSGSGAAELQVTGTTATVDPNNVVITTIADGNVPPGKTLTLTALSGSPGSFSLGTGGTPTGDQFPINLGPFASPLAIASGSSVTLMLSDVSGSDVYTVVGGTGLPAPILASSETLTFNSNLVFSPSFDTSYVALAGNVTGSTMAAGADGQHKTLCFKQGAGSYTVNPPSNVHGFFTVGTTNGDYNCQSFVYNAANSIWLADSPGTINQ